MEQKLKYFTKDNCYTYGYEVWEGWTEITKAEYDAKTQYTLTTERKEQLRKASQISKLKRELAKTDYQAIKYAEGWITEEEYAPIKAQRQALRNQINELE